MYDLKKEEFLFLNFTGNKRDKKKESYDAEDIFPIKKLKIKNKLDRSNNG